MQEFFQQDTRSRYAFIFMYRPIFTIVRDTSGGTGCRLLARSVKGNLPCVRPFCLEEAPGLRGPRGHPLHRQVLSCIVQGPRSTLVVRGQGSQYWACSPYSWASMRSPARRHLYSRTPGFSLASLLMWAMCHLTFLPGIIFIPSKVQRFLVIHVRIH